MASFLIFALFLSQLAHALCPTQSRDINVAAVVSEDEGGIFVLHVDVRPGNGSIYTSINPRTGFSTQESAQQAVDYAFSGVNVKKSECDVLFSMQGDFGGNKVDGPSAGGAMSIAVKAALANRLIRKDVVMTGTISPEGEVGEVGGIIEKSLAAKESGAKYILVPSLMMHEALLLSSISSGSGFSAIEVENFSEAERILFSSYSETFSSDFIPKSSPLPPNLGSLQYDADTGRFSIVASRVVHDLERKVGAALAAARSQGTSSEASEEYFSSEISKYKKQVLMGYPFTAANAAFLLSVDAEYLKIGDADVNIDKSMAETTECISSLRAPVKTAENFHWAVGSDLRRIWAQNKLNDTMVLRSDREAYSTLRDLLLAQGWCGISRELALQAEDIGGNAVNESLLSTLADAKLSEADNALAYSSFPNADAYDHLDKGFDAFKIGAYGAAIYEATYAKSMQEAADESGSKNLSSASDGLAQGSRESLWGKIYQGQGVYLNYAAKSRQGSASDAYRILSYSEALDGASLEIDRALASQQSAPMGSMGNADGESAPANHPSPSQKAAQALALFSCVVSFSGLIFIRVSRGALG
jgi:hypothetical protein